MTNDEPQGSVVQDSRLDKIFFAKQVKIHFSIVQQQ
jgi:ubiquitin carboxyl-terminal hydrolase L5